MPIRFIGKKLPNYVKESIRALIISCLGDKVDFDVTIAKHQEGKTDKQLRYFWELLKQIRLAVKNGQTEHDIYLKILREDGVSDWLFLPEEQIYIAKAWYRIVEDKGQATLSDKKGRTLVVRQLRCWKGLSEYSKEEACMLIEGAIKECQQLGIETDTPDQLLHLKQLWGVDVG